jgi:spoIIIJ-associated protein
VEEIVEREVEETKVQEVEGDEQVGKEIAVAPQPLAEAAADTQQLSQHLVAFLGDVLGAMQLNAKPEVKSVDAQEMLIEIVGEDLAILIGTQGQTLDALQYIAGIVANRVDDSRRRIILDAEGYRERQRDLLRNKALEYAKAAVEAGKEAVLEPQPARDRRIVHLALAEHPDVYTYSEGEGDQRHVVISPKK